MWQLGSPLGLEIWPFNPHALTPDGTLASTSSVRGAYIVSALPSIDPFSLNSGLTGSGNVSAYPATAAFESAASLYGDNIFSPAPPNSTLALDSYLLGISSLTVVTPSSPFSTAAELTGSGNVSVGILDTEFDISALVYGSFALSAAPVIDPVVLTTTIKGAQIGPSPCATVLSGTVQSYVLLIPELSTSSVERIC